MVIIDEIHKLKNLLTNIIGQRSIDGRSTLPLGQLSNLLDKAVIKIVLASLGDEYDKLLPGAMKVAVAP